MENVKAANDERDKIKAEGQYSHLGTTAEEVRLLEASVGRQVARGQAPPEQQNLAEHAIDQGTRLHNFQDSDSVATDLQTRFGERPLDVDADGNVVEDEFVTPPSAGPQGPTGVTAATAPTGPTGGGSPTVATLREQARSLGVTGTSDMNKAELTRAIEKAKE